MMPFAETFAVITRGVTGQDADGNDVYGEVRKPTRGAFAPAGSTESVQGQLQVISHDTLYLDEGQCAPGPQDKMLVRGVVRDVDGTAGQYRHPHTGWTPGPIVRLVSATG